MIFLDSRLANAFWWTSTNGTVKALEQASLVSSLAKIRLQKLLEWGGQDAITLNEFMEIKETGISIERFEKIIKQNQFQVLNRKLFFTNPIYKFKFNVEPKSVLPGLNSIPYFRNYYTTAAYYLIA
ncbi:MAG: hypothetical protein IPG95_00860 [Saprospiraceae bacterium]|nr:hypothetical protein [Saprospiraceae bacterium]